MGPFNYDLEDLESFLEEKLKFENLKTR